MLMTVNPLVARWLKCAIDDRHRYAGLRISRLYLNACADRGTIVHAPGCLFDSKGHSLKCCQECSVYAQRMTGCSELEALDCVRQGIDVREIMRRTDVGNELAALLAVGHGAIDESLAVGSSVWPSRLWFGDVKLPAC